MSSLKTSKRSSKKDVGKAYIKSKDHHKHRNPSMRESHQLRFALKSAILPFDKYPSYVPGASEMKAAAMRAVLSPFLRSGTLKAWIPFIPALSASGAGGTITPVFAVQGTNFDGFTDYQGIFKEYRPLKAVFHYTPYFAGSATNTGVIAEGCSYDSSVTTVTSVNAMLQYSDPIMHSLYKPSTHHMDWQVDMGNAFIDTGTTGTVWGCLKGCTDNNSGVGVSTNYGTYWGFVLIEFRGMQ